MIEKMTVPCYFVTGWFDDSISGGMDHFPRLLKHHDPKVARSQKLLVGPWAHPLSAPYRLASKLGDFDYGPDSVVPLHKEAVRWFDHWLKGKENGIMAEPQVRLFHMGANRWMDHPDFPLAKSLQRELLLSADGPSNTLEGQGRLGSAHGGSESSRYTYDPLNPTPTPFWKEAFQNGTNEDLRYIQSRKDVLVFTSEPLAAPVDMVGMLGSELYVSTSAVDTDFVTRLSDVAPSGYAQRLQHGIMRLRFRDGFECVKLVRPGEIVKVTVGMQGTSHRFAKGHRIRLEVTSSAFPTYAPNFNTGGSTWEETEPIVAEQTVYHSEAYPSMLRFQELKNPKFSPAWKPDRWAE
jgi:putative CocE/NonD family hydrolase